MFLYYGVPDNNYSEDLRFPAPWSLQSALLRRSVGNLDGDPRCDATGPAVDLRSRRRIREGSDRK
jgi:hypothetical protein